MNGCWWKNRSVLVTGGAGFIGSNLVARLLCEGAAVRVVDNLERGQKQYLGTFLSGVDFWEKDLRSPDVCARACERIDVVFHLASRVGGIRYYIEQAGDVFRENTRIDHNMWAAAIARGVPYYVYASSAHIYPRELQQEPDSPPILESQWSPANPELSYGWAKLVGELLCLNDVRQGYLIRVSLPRIIGSYGPNQSVDLATGSAIPVFCRRAIEYPRNGPFVVMGTGVETRSYHYVSDTVEALLRSARKLDQMPCVGPFNLGAEGRVAIGQLAHEIIAISGKSIDLTWDESRSAVIWGQAVDCSLIAQLLDGWKPVVSLREGLTATYEHVAQRLESADALGSILAADRS